MVEDNHHEKPTDKLVHGYNTMMDKLSEWAEKADEQAGPLLTNGLRETARFMDELSDWSKEEIDLISRYVKRDLHDAAVNMEKDNQDLKAWFRFDLNLIEDKILDIFASMTDRTRQELNKLDKMANEWHTGEITGIGTLVCKKCGKEIHFHKPGRIPPCSQCKHTSFERISSDDNTPTG